MSIEDAFGHIDTAEDLEGNAEEHRERALQQIENELQDVLGSNNDVEVTSFDGNYVTAEVHVGELVDAVDDMETAANQVASVMPAKVRISRPIPDIDLSSEEPFKNVKDYIDVVDNHYKGRPGAPQTVLLGHASEVGLDADKLEREIESLRRKGELYEPQNGYIRTT